MDRHTFSGKRKVGCTEISDFTDYQGIGRDPLYKRYDSVNSIVRKVIAPQYAHFLATPDYSSEENVVNWYIDEWNETPERFTQLSEDVKTKYRQIKEATIAHYKEALNRLSGEELQVLICALRYIDDEFVYCCDDKVYVVAWGMTPDTKKHISTGVLVHEVEGLRHLALEPPVPPSPVPLPDPDPEPPAPTSEPEPEPSVPPKHPIIPWYKKIWMWLLGRGCLKWLCWSALVLLLLFLLSWLLPRCKSCARTSNGVSPTDKIVTETGDTIDNNGTVIPIDLQDGRLPEESAIVAPVHEEGGVLPPIERAPGVVPVVTNRLILFLEDENDEVNALAADFKKAYPEDRYSIIGFDKEVKSLLIQIPENERDEIRKTINARIPDHEFIVFDEEIYELNGHPSTTTTAMPGWHLKAVKVEEGWQITKGSSSVVVAVVDDGIDATHPIFKDRIVDAYNVYTQNNKLSCGEGHGTHTAGLAVGSSDYISQGAAGIAPACQLMPVQVVDNKLCPLSALVGGVMYAIHKGADVVNISIGPSFQGLNQLPEELQKQIAKTQFKKVEKLWNRICRLAASKNTVLVFAAGNDDILSSIPPENRTTAAITVGAVDQNLYPTEFTNYGACTDISAPGKEIYSSFPVKDFRSCDGTSMAAPIVTGTVALMKSLKKDITVEQVRNVLYQTGVDVYGNMPPMVQVNQALDAVKRGDFSKAPQRSICPVPAEQREISDEDIPASWTEPDGSAIVVVPEKGGASSEEGVSSGRNPEQTAKPAPAPENDYDAIRRLIEEYQKKINALKKQLPENKKR